MRKVGTPNRGSVALISVSFQKEELSLPLYVIGIPGDTIKVTPEGTFVNGRKSRELPQKGQQTYTLRLREKEYWLSGKSANKSIDSRVIGPVNRSQIEGFTK